GVQTCALPIYKILVSPKHSLGASRRSNSGPPRASSRIDSSRSEPRSRQAGRESNSRTRGLAVSRSGEKRNSRQARQAPRDKSEEDSLAETQRRGGKRR